MCLFTLCDCISQVSPENRNYGVNIYLYLTYKEFLRLGYLKTVTAAESHPRSWGLCRCSTLRPRDSAVGKVVLKQLDFPRRGQPPSSLSVHKVGGLKPGRFQVLSPRRQSGNTGFGISQGSSSNWNQPSKREVRWPKREESSAAPSFVECFQKVLLTIRWVLRQSSGEASYSGASDLWRVDIKANHNDKIGMYTRVSLGWGDDSFVKMFAM